jgi:Ran GTPase-activating protein (RanGAP) involved in mRNA processing and transport
VAQALLGNTTLTELILCSNSFKTQGAEALAQLLGRTKTLQHLNISNNRRMTGTGATAIYEALATNTSLVYLNVNGTPPPSTAALKLALCCNTALQTLHMSDTFMYAPGAKAVAMGLTRNRGLTALNLEYNVIKDEGAAAIAEALSHNSTLRRLDLDHGNQLTEAGSSAIRTARMQHPLLQQLPSS